MAKGQQQQPAPTQTTENRPPEAARRLVELAEPKLTHWAATTPQRYQGEQVAGFTAPQEQGQQMALGAAVGPQADIARGAAGTSGFYLGGDIWNPETNPNLQGAISAVQRPLYERLTEQLLPEIRSSAITSGGFGGSRQGIAETGAIRETERAAADAASKLAQGQYETNVNAQLKALGLAPVTQTTQVTPAVTTSGVGDVQQQLAQRRIDEAVANFAYDQNIPLWQAKELIGAAQAIPGGSTVSTGSVPKPQSTALSALGGAATGATLGNAILPGWGALAGGAGGALLPFLFS